MYHYIYIFVFDDLVKLLQKKDIVTVDDIKIAHLHLSTKTIIHVLMFRSMPTTNTTTITANS